MVEPLHEETKNKRIQAILEGEKLVTAADGLLDQKDLGTWDFKIFEDFKIVSILQVALIFELNYNNSHFIFTISL